MGGINNYKRRITGIWNCWPRYCRYIGRKAALEGFKDIEGVNLIVFYPHGGVSPIQRLQMVTQRGSNTFVSAIRGNFDDAQNGVKEIFADEEYNKLLEEKGFILSSANSIVV